MGTIKFIPGEPIVFENTLYEIVKVIDLTYLVARNMQTQKVETLNINTISSYEKLPNKNVFIDLVDDKYWEIAKNRFEIIKPLLKDKRTKAEVIQRAEENNISYVTLYKWIKNFESTGVLSNLLPQFEKRGGKGKSKLKDQVDEIINDVIEEVYLSRQRLPVKYVYLEVYDRCKKLNLKMVHINTIRNRINDRSDREVVKMREGSSKSRNLYGAAAGSFTPLYPLEFIQIDHTPMDILLVDENDPKNIYRPNLTLIMDIYSRMIYGFYISADPVGTFSTGQALLMGAVSKNVFLENMEVDGTWDIWGLPENLTIATDNAREFRGKDLGRFCEEMNLHLAFRAKLLPERGGHIERMIKTINEETHNLPGTTRSNVQDKGDYNAVANATLTMDDLKKWLTTFIVNVYHEEIHSKIGMSPKEKYRQGILGDENAPGSGLPDLIEGDEAQRLQMSLLPSFRRSIQRTGINFESIRYYADVLRKYIKVKSANIDGKYLFKYDPRDISIIYFFDQELNEYFPIPCYNLGFPSISIWSARNVRKKLQEQGMSKIDEESIMSGYRQMNKIKNDAIEKEKNRKRRKSSKKRGKILEPKEEPLYKRVKEKTVKEQESVEKEVSELSKSIKIYDIDID